MKRATSLLAFIAGAAVGIAGTYLYMSDKFDKRCEACGDKNRETKKSPDEKNEEKPSEPEKSEEPDSLKEYNEMVKKYRYENPAAFVNPSERLINEDDSDDFPTEEYEESDMPYVSSPEEFGEKDDYDTISLMWYEDQILADDNENIIDDVEGTVGFAALTHFGDFEDDAVHVRNDEKRTDYEILRSLRTYKDVAAQRGIIMED